jgi:transposase
MLLKVFVYAYAVGVLSSRRIAKELRKNIHFMWLSGKQRPVYNPGQNGHQFRLKTDSDSGGKRTLIPEINGQFSLRRRNRQG